MTPRDSGSQFKVPPEEDACLHIISDYRHGRVPLETAALHLRDALAKVPTGLNLEMSPAVRRLFAEVAKLQGRSFPDISADPERHAEGGRDMLEDLSRSAWEAVSRHPRASQGLSIGFHFAAATENTARAITQWLEEHDQERIEVLSPLEADADDWLIHAVTPRTQWSPDALRDWVAMLQSTPLHGEASFTGWGV